MDAQFCPQCGTPRTGNFRFCRSCGLDLDQAPPAVQPPAAIASRIPVPPQIERPNLPAINVTAVFIALGGGLIALGAFLPWIQATIPLAGGISRSGMDGGDGPFFLVIGAVTAILGFAIYTGRSVSRFSTSWVVVTALGLVALGLVAFEFVNVQDRISSLDPNYRPLASIGAGIWVIGLGALIVLVDGLRLRSEQQRAGRLASAP